MQEWNTPEYRTRMEAEYRRIQAKHPSLVTVRFECYVGWFPLIERYLDEVARLLAEHPGSEYRAWQVKEKFAGLRLYAGTTADISDGVHAADARAEDEAERTCEVCGRPGVLRQRGQWYLTRCEDHADGGTPVPEGEEA